MPPSILLDIYEGSVNHLEQQVKFINPHLLSSVNLKAQQILYKASKDTVFCGGDLETLILYLKTFSSSTNRKISVNTLDINQPLDYRCHVTTSLYLSQCNFMTDQSTLFYLLQIFPNLQNLELDNYGRLPVEKGEESRPLF